MADGTQPPAAAVARRFRTCGSGNGLSDTDNEEIHVEIDKNQVLDFIRQHAGQGQADQAEAELPDKVDPEQHAGLLSTFGVDPAELIKKFAGDKLGGGLGGLLGG